MERNLVLEEVGVEINKLQNSLMQLAEKVVSLAQNELNEKKEIAIGEQYYTISVDILKKAWENSGYDKTMVKVGNYFKSFEEALDFRQKVEVYCGLRVFAESDDRKWDDKTPHFVIRWDYLEKEIIVLPVWLQGSAGFCSKCRKSC